MLSRFNILVLVIIVIVCLCNKSSCQTNYYLPDIPCPNVFQYAYSGSRTIGIIALNGVKHGRTKVVVELSHPGAYNLDYFGKLSLNFSKHKVFEYIDRGKVLTFKVEFPLENVVPRVTSIEVNSIQICAGPKYGLPSTSTKLEYTLITFPSGSNRSKYYDTNTRHPPFNQDSNLSDNFPEILNINPSFSQQSSLNSPIPNRYSFLNWPSLNGPSVNDLPSDQLTHMKSIYNEAALAFLENPQSFSLDYFSEYQPAEDYDPRNINPYTAILTKPTQAPAIIARPTLEVGQVNPETSTETVHETTRTIFNSSTNQATLEYINSVCGQESPNLKFIKLNVKGTVIRKSRFPWITAVFMRINSEYKFQCGGSLISTRTVVSAAHCFHLGFEVIKPEHILISLGLHDLTTRLDANNINVEKVIQHPDYNPTLINFDADLAVVRLKQSVTFTTLVRPICLWQGSSDIREIEGTSGAIVGWGSDGHRNTTTVPTLVNATIVSEITCIRSNDFFISLTSNRTLCAGNLDGSGPCMGDSGNGLMIKKRNKWMLRGTVSAALGTRTRQCILDQYAVYSDIAKFSDWIHSNMLL